jgi:hypothetical protein
MRSALSPLALWALPGSGSELTFACLINKFREAASLTGKREVHREDFNSSFHNL